jgi:hypothetical protein
MRSSITRKSIVLVGPIVILTENRIAEGGGPLLCPARPWAKNAFKPSALFPDATDVASFMPYGARLCTWSVREMPTGGLEPPRHLGCGF